MANGFVQGFPVSSSGSRTVLGDAAGSRTQVHALVVIAVVVMVLMFAGPVLESFPDAALGALVIYAATRLIDVPEVRRIARFRKSELVITLSTAAAVVIFGVLAGIGFAIALSIVDLLRRITRPYADVLGYAPSAGLQSRRLRDARSVDGLLVTLRRTHLRQRRRLVQHAMRAVEESGTPVRWFLLARRPIPRSTSPPSTP